MSPREKHLALLSALCLVLVSFTFYYIPIFLYATLFFAVCCIVVSYYRNGEPFPARRWLGLSALARLRRWLSNRRWSGVPVAARRGARSGRNKADVRHSSTEHFGDFRIPEAGIYRREALSSESFLFSPRDFLMGSYISKPESPTAQHVTSRAGRNPRELLREKLSRPNHAVYTPNRRLSFSGEPMGSLSRLSITPQRHYPLQQAGPSSMGVLPPVKWDAFRKKNVLSPRNSQSAMSPVTVKIARPDHHSIPSFEHVSCAGLPRAPADPCSRESVLKVLKESRKREPEDHEASFTAEQRSKRRRNDSGGSSHSAFGSLLPNGTPSQLVPKPGTLKRGLLSLAEESIMKRSRTSSVSSASGTQRGTQSGTPGSRRNPINSSYSSSKGLGQWKKRSAPSSTLSSPGSSRPQTPEGIAKRPREDDGQSPSSASSVRSDHTAAEKAPATSKLTPVPKIPVTTATASYGSGGKRKRKIQLVSSHRDDHISLPPPPEIGYVITVKDLDEEKKAAISKIQKVLETPAPEPEKSISAPISSSSSAPAFTTSASTLSSLLSTPLSLAPSPAIPVINLDPTPTPTPNPTSTSTPVSTAPTQAPNPLLEMLKKSTTPASFTTTSDAAAATTTVSATTTPAQPSILGNLKLPTTLNSSQPQPSAFTQVLGQVTKATSSTASPLTITGSGGLFGIGMGPISSPSSSSTVSNTVTANATATSSLGSVNTTTPNPNPLLASGFKPIFSVTTTTSPAVSMTSPESKPPMPQCFTPIFGQPASLANTTTASNQANLAAAASSTFSTTAANTTPSMSMFGGLTGSSTATVATSGFPGLTTDSMATQQPTAMKSLFGFGIAPSSATTSTSSTLASTLAQPLANANTGSTFQFGAPATMTTAAVAPATTVPTATTTSGSGAFGGFGATQPDQKVFSFGQGAPIQSNNTTAQPSNTFGGFGMATTAPSSMTTTAANTQSTFSFGKSSFQSQPTTLATGQPPSFSSTQSATPNTQASKPFSFGAVASSSTPTPASNLNLNPTANQPSFAFGSGTAAITTATTFGTPSQPTGFGGASSTGGFAFGGVGASNTAVATTAANSINPLANSINPLAAAPSFGAVTQQTQSALPQSSNAFSFGGSVATTNQQVPVNPLATTTQSGFNFGGAGMPPCPQFGTPVASNPNTQMGFNFGAAADKPAFGTSTPAFGQSSAAAGPIPFGSPATPVPGFNQSFGSPATPSFSIGAGSKPSGARQRLQARRQHNRKK